MVNGLSLVGSAVAVATPRSDCSGGFAVYFRPAEKKKRKKSSRSFGAQK